MHYAVPRLLNESERLEKLYTDICAVKGWPQIFGLFPNIILSPSIRRYKSRVPHGIPRRLIKAFTDFGLEYQFRRSRAASANELTAIHLWAGEHFCNLILESNPPTTTNLYCFNSAGLELLQHWQTSCHTTVIEQTIAPRRIENQILYDEEQAYPEWQAPVARDANIDAYMIREEAEWSASKVIVCGSEFVKSGIAQCGGPVERCTVVPYGIPLTAFPGRIKTFNGKRPLRVLTVGEVCLRKGSQYVLQAAQRLAAKVDFRMAGPMGLLPERATELKKIITCTGIVDRREIAQHFAWADLFLLPSLCEGSATVTYEALAAGLPVIVTASTGSIVEHGVCGFCISERNIDAIVSALEVFLDKPMLLREMSSAALEKSRYGSLQAYGQRLLGLFDSWSQ